MSFISDYKKAKMPNPSLDTSNKHSFHSLSIFEFISYAKTSCRECVVNLLMALLTDIFVTCHIYFVKFAQLRSKEGQATHII